MVSDDTAEDVVVGFLVLPTKLKGGGQATPNSFKASHRRTNLAFGKLIPRPNLSQFRNFIIIMIAFI